MDVYKCLPSPTSNPRLETVFNWNGRILQRERVGYELLAVKAIFRKHWPDLKRCIAVANQVVLLGALFPCDKDFFYYFVMFLS